MANEDHLKILKQGVEIWNKWREKNSKINPDISRAKFSGANFKAANFKDTNLRFTSLNGANLSGVDFRGADLHGTDIRQANLSEANLEKADLRNKTLFRTNLCNANLTEADLSAASISETQFKGANLYKLNFTGVDLRNIALNELNLREAVLSKVDLSGANLSGSDFTKSDLTEAHLNRANLCKANLHRAVLKKAYLIEANLSKANLHQADFIGAVLNGADLSEAVLSEAEFRGAFLLKADLRGANLRAANFGMSNLTMSNLEDADLSGACLFSTGRDNWIIDGIKCDYVFWDNESKSRVPKDRNFRPREFEELYKQLPTIEYVFEHGFNPIDAFVMDQVVQAINNKNPEFELKLDSFHSRGQPHAVFTVLHKDAVDEALNQIKSEYEARIAKLEGERDALEQCFNRALEEPRTIIKKIEMGEKYEIKGQTGAVGAGAHAYDIKFTQVWNQLSSQIDTVRLSEELTQLRLAMKKEAETLEHDTAVGEIAAAETAVQAKEGHKALEHLKKAGKWAFRVAENIGTTIAAEALKKAMGL